MGNSVSGQKSTSTGIDNAISLLDLPLETILEVVSYLDTEDIMALRSSCPYMYAVLLDTFGKQAFSRLYVMPTKFSLKRLLEIAKDGRMKFFTKELTICCSIYQDRGSRYTPPTFPRMARSNITSWPRILREDETPFRNPASPEQEVTNEAVNFVRKGGFEKELTTALQALDITSVEIHTYRQMRYLDDPLPLMLGRSQLIQRTGRDPFKKPGGEHRKKISRAWEYASSRDDRPMDMVTCMTSSVLSAIEVSQTPLQTLIIPVIQIDNLKISPTLGCSLKHLQHLEVTISLAKHQFSCPPQLSELDLISFINHIPALRHLELTTWAVERLIGSSLSLHLFLPRLKPLQLESLHLHNLCDASSDLVPFLEPLKTLKTLSLYFVVIKEKKNKPWRDMLLGLKDVLSRVRDSEMYIDHWDAFELSKMLQSKSSETPDDEDLNDDKYWDDNAWRKSEKLEKNDMLEVLAQTMPHYHDSVFRTCRMGSSLCTWY